VDLVLLFVASLTGFYHTEETLPYNYPQNVSDVLEKVTMLHRTTLAMSALLALQEHLKAAHLTQLILSSQRGESWNNVAIVEDLKL
jgi:hypothetical protein